MKKLLLLACSLLLFTGCGEKKEEENLTNSIKKICCQQYGGKWENSDCVSPGVPEAYFDDSGYKECVQDSSAQ